MLRDRIYCRLPLCMERATKQTRFIQSNNESKLDLGVTVELMRAGTAEIKTVKPEEGNYFKISQMFDFKWIHSTFLFFHL